jgi:hypothetical protein
MASTPKQVPPPAGVDAQHDYRRDVAHNAGLPSWWILSLGVAGEDEIVTVGIGVLCNGGDMAIIASDLRTSFPRSNICPNDDTGKTWDFNIPIPLIAAVAGTLGDCATVVSELNRLLREHAKKGEIFTENVENAVRDARLKGWARCVDWAIRMSYGITLKQWQTGKVPGGKIDQFIHDSVTKLIDAQPFNVELLLAGYSSRGNILFYKGSRKTPIEPGVAPGVLVIGSGGNWRRII